MFRNIIAYALPNGWPHSAAGTAEFLARRTFQPCGPQDTKAAGFVPPREESELCHPVAGRYLVCHQTEEKLLPAAVVAEYVELRSAELQQHQGYRPGRRQLKELKEQVLQELLPQAFTKKRRILVWINPASGWLMVDASSSNRAEDVLSDMRQALDVFPVALLRTARAPAGVMSDWLAAGEANAPFTIDHDCELVSPTEDKASVRYARHELDRDEVRRHIEGGKRPVLLGLTFDDRLSFIVDESLELKRILPLDILTKDRDQADNAAEQFDADFTLEAAEIERAMEALVGAAGGLWIQRDPDLVDMANQAGEARAAFNRLAESVAADGGGLTISTGDGRVLVGAGNEHDPLYPDATRVVLENGRPSISLIQRHLRIGYNRAARLIEQMERDGLVSAMKADGTREVLAA